MILHDIDMQRLRRLGTYGEPGMSAATKRLISDAVLELDARRMVQGRIHTVKAERALDDDRWRGAEFSSGGAFDPNKVRDRVMWEGIARDLGAQILEYAGCAITAGSGLVTFSAGIAIVQGADSPQSLVDMGGFRVRVLHDNRAAVTAAAIEAAQLKPAVVAIDEAGQPLPLGDQ